MEEEWVRIAKLGSREHMLEEDEKYFNDLMDFWRKKLNDEKIEYRFKIEESVEIKGFDHIKGINRKNYDLNLYAKEEDRERIKELIDEVNEEN